MRACYCLMMLCVFVLNAGCSLAAPPETRSSTSQSAVGQGQLSATPATGYKGRCAMCHENNGFGVQRLRARLGDEYAVLSERDNLTAEFIRIAVRKGFLAMPPMSKVEVPDSELEKIIVYLTRSAEEGGDASD